MSFRLISNLARRVRLTVARRRRRGASVRSGDRPRMTGRVGMDEAERPTGPAPLAARLIESKRRRVRRVTPDGSILSDAA